MTVLGAIFKGVSEAAIEAIDASLAVVLAATSAAVLDVTFDAVLRAAPDAVLYAVFYAAPAAVLNAVFTASSMHLRCILAAVPQWTLDASPMHP